MEQPIRSRSFSRSRNFPWIAVIVLAVGSASAAARSAVAQSSAETSSADREQAYQELVREAEPLERLNRVVRKAARFVRPSVVHIDSVETSFPRNEYIEEAGSGVIVSFQDRYFVLTNRHVILSALNTPDGRTRFSNITVELSDRRRLNPVRIWDHPETDVAIMEIKPSYGESLIAARIGDSDAVDVGDFVIAVGSPFALSHSFTFGIISAKGRRRLELGSDVDLKEFMQIDAAINPGNSGGPLINMRGEVIGLNTAIASASGNNEGIGFTIPINMAMRVARQMVERNEFRRGFLGVTLDRSFSPEKARQVGLSNPLGAMLREVQANSPAAAARLKPRDVILEFNGVRVQDDLHLINLSGLAPIGSVVHLKVFREGRTLDLEVVVGDRTDFEIPSQGSRR